jgi:hypothetical protein
VKARLLASLAAILALVGLALAPVPPALSAAERTGTLRVQLTTPSGADWQEKGFYVVVNGMTKDVYDEARTDANGTAVVHVPPGKYRITVETYRTQYEYAISTQDYIKIARGQTKTIGMAIYRGASILGTVRTPNGKPLSGAVVAVTKPDGVLYGFSTSDKKGRYAIRGLQTGKYVVMFNQRTWADPKSDPIQDYGWSYYQGDSMADAKRVHVYRQNQYIGATTTRGISGTVEKGSLLTASLAEAGGAKSRLLVDRVNGKGKYVASESVYAPFDKAGTRAQVRMHSGTYRLGVKYAGDSYYYTGEGATLTTDATKARLVSIDGAYPGFAFGARP